MSNLASFCFFGTPIWEFEMRKTNAIQQEAEFQALIDLVRPGLWNEIGSFRVASLTIELIHRENSQPLKIETSYKRGRLLLESLEKKGCMKQ